MIHPLISINHSAKVNILEQFVLIHTLFNIILIEMTNIKIINEKVPL
jgi:hypothetical protein